MDILKYLKMLAIMCSLFLGFLGYASMALAEDTEYEYDSLAMYNIAEDKADFDTLGYDYPPGNGNQNRRCELVVIIVNLTNDYSRQRFTFWGQGRSWGDSRRDAFNRYFQSINTGRFWQNNFNHSFAYRNCG